LESSTSGSAGFAPGERGDARVGPLYRFVEANLTMVRLCGRGGRLHRRRRPYLWSLYDFLVWTCRINGKAPPYKKGVKSR